MEKGEPTSSLAHINPLLQGHQVRALDGVISSKVQLSGVTAVAKLEKPRRARANRRPMDSNRLTKVS
jgi:CBS-domain-containing membrane protein